MLYLFTRKHSFFVLELHDCFKSSLLFQFSLFINFLLWLSIILDVLFVQEQLIFTLFLLIIFVRGVIIFKCLFIKPKKIFAYIDIREFAKRRGLNKIIFLRLFL